MNLNEAKSILKNNGFILNKNRLNENTVYGVDSKKWEEMRKNYDYYTGDQIRTRNNGPIYCLVGCGGAIKGPGHFGEIVSVDVLNHKIKFKSFRTNNTYEYNIDTRPNWKGYGSVDYKENKLYDKTGKCYKIKNIQGLPESYDPNKPFSYIMGQITEFKNNVFTLMKEDYDKDNDNWPPKMVYTELKIEVEPGQKELPESWTLNQAAGLLNEDFDLASDGISSGVLGYDTEEFRKRLKQQSMLPEDIDSDSSFNEVFDTLTKTRDIWLKELQKTLPEGYHVTAYTGSCANGLSKKIPGINITKDAGMTRSPYILSDSTNPRKIEFEGVACTTNGWEQNVVIHYPGVRRMATRFTLPVMYNCKKTVANIVKDITG